MSKRRTPDIFDIENDELDRMLMDLAPDRMPAPPDPGFKPGGIRERALDAVLKRGPQQEDEEKTKASQAYWAAYRASKNARGGDDGDAP